jgi:phage/plasmid-like protein (TIGR03299 family)
MKPKLELIDGSDNMIVRQPAWHGLGINLRDVPTADAALKKATLSWNVAQAPVQWMEADGTLRIDGSYMCNYRDDTGTLLGIVGHGYTVVQNADAFEFADHLIGEGVQYEYVGSNRGGKRVWLLAKMPEQMILQDAYAPYLLFANGHDGKTAINVCMTPVRLACWNTMNLALRCAKQRWSFCHTTNVISRLTQARETLALASTYLTALKMRAEKLASIKVSRSREEAFIKQLFPAKESAVANRNNDERIARFRNCYAEPDLDNFRGTAYGLLAAVSDYTSHKSLHTDKQRERHFFQTVVQPAGLLSLSSSLLAA